MSVQFSSHTGYPGWRGRAFDASMIDECAAGLEAIGVLPRCAGLLTGYLGKPEIGEAALGALARIRAVRPDAAYACDPVIGDAGGSYVAPGVAEFFRDRALPAATIATPNAFELEWLTGAPARTLADARTAVEALRARGPRVVAVTSLIARRHRKGRARPAGFRRSWPLAAQNAETADRGQRGRRPVRRPLPSPLARPALHARGAVENGLVGVRDCRRDAGCGRAGAGARRGAGGTRAAVASFYRRARLVENNDPRSFTFSTLRRKTEPLR